MNSNEIRKEFIDFLGNARIEDPSEGEGNIHNFMKSHNIDETTMEKIFMELLDSGDIAGDWGHKIAGLEDKTYKKWRKNL